MKLLIFCVLVVDNGSGIIEENFRGITAKHFTSKLKEFSDLERIETFGFRGEALSSLCAVSNLVVTTRHRTTEHGTRLLFEHDGAIKKKSTCARNIGTTVSVTDFFITLPVRRGEFLKNYKKDFGKMVQLLQEYCLVLTGIKIICTNQPPNGARQTILSTNGSSVMDNIIAIFGAKQAKELIKIKNPTDDQTEEGVYTQESLADLDRSNSILDIKQSDLESLNASQFKIEGFISKIDHNCARSSKDRQFFYVNSRPVELRVSKVINEVYHRYNLKQFPFVYLNLKMNQSGVDVNLSKDKRQVAICNDSILELAIKRSLLNTFGELSTKFKRVNINTSVRRLPASGRESSEEEEDKITIIEPSSNFGDSLRQWKTNSQNPIPPTSSHKRKSSNEPKGQKTPKIKLSFHQKIREIEIRNSSFEDSMTRQDDEEEVSVRIDYKPRKSVNTLKFEVISKSSVTSQEATAKESQAETPNTETLEETFLVASSEDESEPETSLQQTLVKSPRLLSGPIISPTLSQNDVIFIDSQKPNLIKHSCKIKVSLESIRSMVKAEEEAYEKLQQEKKSGKMKLRFKESIDPTKNKKAEAELETEIKKEMFKEMEVLGQFNLGFIIAKLKSDLFIVDQHASDEKYNFEDLQNKTKLETQPLVVPEKLELTAIQEMTLIENLSTFEVNGFKFLIDENAEAGSKVKIHSKPHSKNWEFGREDIEEMIFMLDDSPPGSICRPSRIRTMLASRACRKSIMIGDALTKKQMKKLLENMGELDHPWNCPHGRPTLRYLQNLDIINNTKF